MIKRTSSAPSQGPASWRGRQRGREKLPLFAESETHFFRRTADTDSDFEFFKRWQGVVTHFHNYFGGPAMKETRK
jgi:hypothetical protein